MDWMEPFIWISLCSAALAHGYIKQALAQIFSAVGPRKVMNNSEVKIAENVSRRRHSDQRFCVDTIQLDQLTESCIDVMWLLILFAWVKTAAVRVYDWSKRSRVKLFRCFWEMVRRRPLQIRRTRACCFPACLACPVTSSVTYFSGLQPPHQFQ